MDNNSELLARAKKLKIFLCIALFILCCSCFDAALLHGFVWDDSLAVVANSNIHGISAENIKWALGTRFAGHYQPLSWLTLMLDYQVWGLDPFGFHLTNIIIHALNAVLLFLCILTFQDIFNRRFPLATSPTSNTAVNHQVLLCAFFAVLFYAIHPLRVESVAWVTERRDVLSIFFILISLNFYFRHSVSNEPQRFSWYYNACFATYILSLSCKAWGITYPVVLILVDLVLQRDPVSGKQVIASIKTKLPFVLASVLFAYLAYSAQSGAGAVISWEKMGLVERLLQSAHGFNMYLLKTVYPFNLSPLYSLAQANFFQPYYYFHFAFSLFLFFLCLYSWKRNRLPLLLFMIYLVLLSPVIGITQSGPQHMADRYSYFALLLLSFLIATVGARLLMSSNAKNTRQKHAARLAFVLAVLVLIGLGARTSQQLSIWKNEELLWTHAIKVDRGNFQAFINRGEFRARNGFCNDAVADYGSALELDPENSYALNGRAHCLLVLGKNRAALADLDRAIRIYPRYVNAWFNRAVVLNNLGDVDGAISNFREVLSLIGAYEENNQYSRNTNFYLGMIYLNAGNAREALNYFSETLNIDGKHGAALYYRASTQLRLKEIPGAIDDLEKALLYLERDSSLHNEASKLLDKLKEEERPQIQASS